MVLLEQGPQGAAAVNLLNDPLEHLLVLRL
jgi:hypothetical protein